jgi:hypothetical protein
MNRPMYLHFFWRWPGGGVPHLDYILYISPKRHVINKTFVYTRPSIGAIGGITTFVYTFVKSLGKTYIGSISKDFAPPNYKL